MTALTMLTFASMALGSSHHPKGEFAPFGECPLNRTVTTDCLIAVVEGGSFVVGGRTVPIKYPLTLQGGFSGAGSGVKFYGAENGVTMSKVPQPIPADIFPTAPIGWPKSVQNWFNESLRKGPGVTATVELAAPATSIKLNTENLLYETGVALQLPLKIKLGSPLLGSACYVGSDKSPIVVSVGTGTNGKLRGLLGELSFNEAFTLITIENTKLVDNTFATGTANGCGGTFSAFVNPLINSIFGMSPSGRNFIVFETDLLDAAAEAVRESE